ncbi:zinc ribbon domain-containing protein [Clostridium algoriphilum]|uniref:zinc ribbon domain-containing protein n=1 Tax=Clostridium algoriphilum TaxID=198347 RepID=UPI001CF48BBB|nr:zinc ribbon domain-containing protein [Clostridium algoriphilum]MCB2292427.1 zinc ribbon domain-containing protein [Clostridium algoriphilum]
MALINCPECEKEISDTTKQCPNCGFKRKKPKKTIKQKKLIISIAILCVCIIGIGTPITISYIQNKTYENNLSVADDFFKNKQYDKALSAFKSLQTDKNTSDVTKKIKITEEKIIENENRNKVVGFVNFIKKLQETKLRSGITVTLSDMEYSMRDLVSQLKTFEGISANDKSELSTYIIAIKDSLNYKLMKIQANSDSFKNTGLADGYGQIDAQMNAINTISVASARNTINDAIDEILLKQIPTT